MPEADCYVGEEGLVERLIPPQAAIELGPGLVQSLLDYGHGQGLLGRKVVEQGASGDPGCLGDVSGGGLLETLFYKQFTSAVDDPSPGLLLLLGRDSHGNQLQPLRHIVSTLIICTMGGRVSSKK
jgi:hypothetical protein